MKVRVKDLAATIEIKNKGIELGVRDNQDNFLGDLVVTKAHLIWCPGKTTRENGKKITWKSFIDYMQNHAS
jgi:hypothetical protein